MASTSQAFYTYTRLGSIGEPFENGLDGIGVQNEDTYITFGLLHLPLSLTTQLDYSMGVRARNDIPYFGLTGVMLNVWVTVACTTAMTLFGSWVSYPPDMRIVLILRLR